MNGIKLSCLVVSAALLSGCGSSGGGGGGNGVDPPDPPTTILTAYNFEIGGVQPGMDMNVDVGSQYEVGVDFGDTLRGSVNLQVISETNVVFLDFVTDVGSTMTISFSGSESDLDGQFVINVTSEVTAGLDDEPSSGAFEIVSGADVTTVTFLANGVELSLNGAPAVAYGWDDYDDLLEDDQAETWLRRASLAGGALAFTFERFFEIAEILDELDNTESGVPIVTPCDAFPGTPPAGVIVQGEHVFTRLGSGEDLAPGDVFDWTFTNCWFESSMNLVDNFIQMQNYIEVIDASNTLTSIGFAPDNNNIGGGVLYFDWTVAETEENMGVYTIDPDDRTEINGGFSMLFTQP